MILTTLAFMTFGTTGIELSNYQNLPSKTAFRAACHLFRAGGSRAHG